MATYGYCPHCGALGRSRERRPDGNDTCDNGHVYPSKASLREPPTPVTLKDFKAQMRDAVADYIRSEGCSCCRGDDHDMHQDRLAQLLDVPRYDDDSGNDFYQFGTKGKETDDATSGET